MNDEPLVPDQREGQPDFPGYCIHLFDESVWLKQDGKSVTIDYEKRGCWPTLEEARAVRQHALEAMR